MSVQFGLSTFFTKLSCKSEHGALVPGEYSVLPPPQKKNIGFLYLPLLLYTANKRRLSSSLPLHDRTINLCKCERYKILSSTYFRQLIISSLMYRRTCWQSMTSTSWRWPTRTGTPTAGPRTACGARTGGPWRPAQPPPSSRGDPGAGGPHLKTTIRDD